MLGRSIGFEPVKLHLVDDAATLPPELTAQLERLWLVRAEATGPDGLRVDFKLTVGSDLAGEIVDARREQPGLASRRPRR